MRAKKIVNFSVWRKKMKKLGIIKSNYPALKKNGDPAELIGVILGDSHSRQFPCTEELAL